MTRETLLDRPLPTLAQWLGDGARAEGFEQWVRDVVEVERAVGNADEAAALRIMRTLSIACIETLRTEDEQHGRNDVTTALVLARIVGVVIATAVFDRLDVDKCPPYKRIAGWLTEEFGHGASMMAKSTAAANRRPAA